MGVENTVNQVRAFNRFYTGIVGALGGSHLDSGYSLTEVRVLYELAVRDSALASDIARHLSLDPGYLSRIVRRFRNDGLVGSEAAQDDARRAFLSLTAKGRRVFEPLDKAASAEVRDSLATLSEPQKRQIVAAMETIQNLLGGRSTAGGEAVVLRGPRPGDYGIVASRQGILYAEEYGWDLSYEALVSEIIGQFGLKHDPKRERCWVVERGGDVVGSIFVVKRSQTVAQLRLLYVDPSARGLGVGRLLVDEVIKFSRAAGYKKITLWTNSVLVSARRIYEAAGFALVSSEKHRSFGKDLIGQNWELKL